MRRGGQHIKRDNYYAIFLANNVVFQNNSRAAAPIVYKGSYHYVIPILPDVSKETNN
jgi:hypothetical protein